MQASDELSLMTWDARLDEVQREEGRARLRCVWEALRAEDLDPAPDFECQIRRTQAMTECLREVRTAGRQDDCVDAFGATCEFSAACERNQPRPAMP